MLNRFFPHDKICEDIRKFNLVRCSISRCYFGSEYRNQWINWDGDTSVVGRYGARYVFSIDDMKKICENDRKNGSCFAIKELPMFIFESNSERISLSWHDFYLSTQCENFVNLFDPKLNIYDTLTIIRKEYSDVCVYYGDIKNYPKLAAMNPDLPFMIRKSSPGKNGSSMVWSCKPLSIDMIALERWLEKYSMAGYSVY